MSQGLRRFTKPEGFDKRNLRGNAAVGTAPQELRSFAAAQARAAEQNVSLDQLLAAERSRLHESNYPGPDCFEPYEIEDFAGGRLATERLRHADVCEGCRVLLSGTGARDAALEFLSAMEGIDIEPHAEPRREFTLELVSAAAAFVAVAGLGFVFFRFGPRAADLSTQAAVITQLGQVVSQRLLASLWVISIGALSLLAMRYAQEVRARARGALLAGLIGGVLVASAGWHNATSVAGTMETTAALAQEQLTESLAAAGGPLRFTAATGTAARLATTSPLITTTATARHNGQALVSSTVKGLPGSVVADFQSSGGNVYWELANRKEQLGHILYGRVDAAKGANFVLIDSVQREHTIKKPVGAPEVPTGSEVMVLMSPANEPLSVHRLTRRPQPE